MRKLILTTATASICLTSMALAADLPARAYTKAPEMMQAAYDWSGFYIGINGGGGTGDVNWNLLGAGDEGSHNPSGATFGGQVGYRWQMASWVFGLEAQGNWADFKDDNISLQGAWDNQTRVNAFGLFTGQIGYAWDRTLFYVKGGAAVTDNRYRVYDVPTSALIDSANETRWGAAIGAGFEYAFAPNWSLGFEYDHLFMGGNDVTFFPSTAVDHIHQDVDLFTARLNYKFGGPVMARY
ncbi:MAG: outer membrane beta-barrel protein [Hyphomicrobiales bacterium]|nr:outer membrane beta-barrel protein [Hyphomicrobiales bacterium]